jgi:phosphatidylglycerol---prolipoprotein diacylglyceryl transferase
VYFESPGSVLLKLGPVVIHWYGLMIALGCISAIATAARLSKQFNFDQEKVINCALYCFLGGVIGARIYYVCLKADYFAKHLLEIPATWLGGLSIHGGLVGATILGALYCRNEKLKFWSMCDLLATITPLAQAIGRWGNFFNSELYGLPVPDSFPVKLFIAPEYRLSTYRNASFYHPTFLYESVLDLALFVLLLKLVLPRATNYPGLTFMTYLSGYSVIRLIVEPLRVDSFASFGGIQSPIIASAAMLAVAIIGAAIVVVRHRRMAKA